MTDETLQTAESAAALQEARERLSVMAREMAALSTDKETLMTATTHWRERAEKAEAARVQFQRETLRTGMLMRLVQWASARYATAHLGSWDHKTQHAPGQFFDDCESCWFREVAADLRSRDTDTVLAEVGVTLDRGPGLPAALDRSSQHTTTGGEA